MTGTYYALHCTEHTAGVLTLDWFPAKCLSLKEAHRFLRARRTALMAGGADATIIDEERTRVAVRRFPDGVCRVTRYEIVPMTEWIS